MFDLGHNKQEHFYGGGYGRKNVYEKVDCFPGETDESEGGQRVDKP